MPDVFVALVIILIISLVWRGPKTLPQLGALFGRGVRAAREEADRMKAERPADSATPPDDALPPSDDAAPPPAS